MKGSSSYDQRIEKSRYYYMGLSVDDEYIFALYRNVPFDVNGGHIGSTNIVHVYNWDGDFLKKIKLDFPANQIVIDSKKNAIHQRSRFGRGSLL